MRELELNEGLNVILTLLKVESIIDDLYRPENFLKLLEVLADISEPAFREDIDLGPDYDSFEDTERGRSIAIAEHESDKAWLQLHEHLKKAAGLITLNPYFYQK